MSDNQHVDVPEGEAAGQATHLPLANQAVQEEPNQSGQAAAQNDSREAATGSPGAALMLIFGFFGIMNRCDEFY